MCRQGMAERMVAAMAEVTAEQLHALADLGDLLVDREYIMDAVLPGGSGSPPVALDVYDERMGHRVYVGQAAKREDWRSVENAYYARRRKRGWRDGGRDGGGDGDD